MRAYVFWHYPRPDADLREYERSLRDFHATLAGAGSDGFVESGAHAVEGAPWLPTGAGYEDWYLVESSAALDPLDEAAVSTRTRASHDRVARMADGGAGGVYRLRRDGGPAAETSTCIWVRKPAGHAYDAFHADLERRLPADASVWQRQMVLGPAPEYGIVLPGDVTDPPVPDAWTPVVVRRRRVWP
ncbi:MAG TPA: hypothetical protein VF212_01485 [Longimicrobiales bacterium]